MNKKEYLIEELIDQAHVISMTAATANPSELGADILNFIAIVHLCGEEELLAPLTPQEAEQKIKEKQASVNTAFLAQTLGQD